MAIPSQADFHRPLLEVLVSSGGQKHVSELYEIMIATFQPTNDELAERIPSGALKFEKRMLWAVSYLKQANLITVEQRGYYRSTDTGANYLKNAAARIETADLTRMFKKKTDGVKEAGTVKAVVTIDPIKVLSSNLTGSEQDSGTPDERVRTIWSETREVLIDQILEQLQQLNDKDFELLVLQVLQATGFDEVKHTGKSGDGGIDGILSWGPFGINEVYVQIKQRGSSSALNINATPVSSSDIDRFSGSLDKFSANIGFFITNSTFTKGARDAVDRMSKKIYLIDGKQLAETMIEQEIGIKTIAEYKIQELDESFNFFASKNSIKLAQ